MPLGAESQANLDWKWTVPRQARISDAIVVVKRWMVWELVV